MRTVMTGTAKRAAIIELARVQETAEKVARRSPASAARMLEQLWELRRELDFGCRPQVVRG